MKRICSLLCAAALGLSGTAAVFPAELTVFAEEDALYSGTCGENLTWEFGSKGTLTIRGTGAMENSPSWSRFDLDLYIKTVNLPDGLTSIGDGAFDYCSELTKITIPASVTSIGINAFAYCVGLTEITIPDSVTSIGQGAFSYCGLTEITIPASVTSIRDYTFFSTKLTEITIPASVTSIGNYALPDCENLMIKGYTGSYAETYAKKGKIPFIRLDGTLGEDVPSFGPCGENLTWEFDEATGTLTITGTGEIQDYSRSAPWNAFSEKIKKVKLSDGVTSIGNSAFYVCVNLTSVTLPDSLTRIGNLAFNGCTSLTSVTLPDNLTRVGNAAFLYTGLTEIIIPNSVTNIEDCAFGFCESLTEIIIPNSNTRIGFLVFEGSENLTIKGYAGSYAETCAKKNKIPFVALDDTPGEDVPTSGICGEHLTWEFDEATGTLTITGTGEMQDYPYSAPESEYYFYAPWNAFREKIKTVKLSDGVTSIGNSAFYVCMNLTAVTLPDSVTRIGNAAFLKCTSLSAITIPDNVTNIETSAFHYCTGLTEISIPNSVTSIGYRAFSNCASLTEITIPDSVTYIGDNAFTDCTNLTEITIPDSVTSIGAWTFDSCGSLTKITIPDSVTSIGDYAFLSCSRLTEIIIPSSVTYIGEDAFAGCGSLTIKGYAGSAAEAYAKENNIPFIGLDDAPAFITSDLTGDGAADVADAVLFARALAEDAAADLKNPLPDLNGDGLITLLDLRALLRSL